jgi:type I restriction enzyme S subunit
MMQNLFPHEGEKVPKYRFKEFENDGEWCETTLGDIGNFIGGGTPDTTKAEYWNGDIQWYTPTEVKEGKVGKSIRTITELGLKNSSAKLLPKGSLLLTTRATIGDIAIADFECTTNQGFQSLVVKETEINTFWFYWIIRHKNELIKKSSGSTFPEIGKTEITKINALKPNKPEQQKIASCLSSLDALITAQGEKIEQLKQHKKGLMQGMFPKIEI